MDTRQRARDRTLVFASFGVRESASVSSIHCTACGVTVVSRAPSPCSPDTYRDILIAHLRGCRPAQVGEE